MRCTVLLDTVLTVCTQEQTDYANVKVEGLQERCQPLRTRLICERHV